MEIIWNFSEIFVFCFKINKYIPKHAKDTKIRIFVSVKYIKKEQIRKQVILYWESIIKSKR